MSQRCDQLLLYWARNLLQYCLDALQIGCLEKVEVVVIKKNRYSTKIRCLPLAFLSVLVLADLAAAQSGHLMGRVRDEQGATLEGALARALDSNSNMVLAVASTDDLGFFELEDLPGGIIRLEVQRLGFIAYSEEFQLGGTETRIIDVELQIQALELEGLTVEGTREPAEIAFEEEAGLTVRAVEAADLRIIPGFIEPDPIRVAEVLPGVISTSDFSASFNVRGGSADQNLILLDGIPIFNPAHLGGLVSVFNSDMVRRAELSAGGFPAEYGGRVSSVLNVESDPGNGQLEVQGAISLLMSRAAVGGSLPQKAKNVLGLRDARWRVSGRRSYFDLLTDKIPYRLEDGQFVFEGWTEGGDRLSITGYKGADVLGIDYTESFPLSIDWDFGNSLIGSRWTHPTSGGGSVDGRVGYSKFSTDLQFPDFGDVEFSSKISQKTMGIDWESRPTRGITAKVGVEGRFMEYQNSIMGGGTQFWKVGGPGTGTSSYTQLQWRPTNSWVIEPGIRFDTWSREDAQRMDEISPRLSFKRFLVGRRLAVKTSVGRYTQFLHSVRDEDLPLGIDIWVLAGPDVPRVLSDQGQLGLEWRVGNSWLLSLEGYLRDFDDVITENFGENPNDTTDDFLKGRGRSYGVDLFAQRFRGSTTGWITVGWLKALRTFPDYRSADLANEIEFPPIFDRRVDVDVVLNHDFWNSAQVGLRWNFGTGLPFTEAVGVFSSFGHRVSNGTLGRDERGNTVFLGPKNGERYPVRHRLDVSIRKEFRNIFGAGYITPYINVLNVYDRRNVLFYFYTYEDGSSVDNTKWTRRGFSMFPILPTFGFEMRFR